MKRDITIFLTDASSAGAYKLQYPALTTAIRAQLFASATVFFRYVIVSVRAWGAPGDGTAISIVDSSYGISAADAGSFSSRPKVGIYYPPSTRSLHNSDTTGDVVSFASGQDEENIYIAVAITIWTVADYSL
jgi:hypothetical protein